MTYEQALKKAHKQLQGLTGQEQVQLTKEVTGNDWESVDDKYKYGILVKKEIYLKPVQGGTMDYNQNEFVERSRIVTFAEHLTYSEEAVKMVMAKYKF